MDVSRLVELNAAYARAIDNEKFEEWPDFFLDPCLYKVTTADNVAQGLEAGVMYADSRGMLQDRISALRQANIYERQRYRHIVGRRSSSRKMTARPKPRRRS
jgi:3-phenylpropionate/cinnamic acid dioxygenase small subunit